jgi:hypothetical protein
LTVRALAFCIVPKLSPARRAISGAGGGISVGNASWLAASRPTASDGNIETFRGSPRSGSVSPGSPYEFESWNVDLEKTVGFAQRLERLELDSDLLRRMKEANASGSTAWDRWLRGQHPDA